MDIKNKDDKAAPAEGEQRELPPVRIGFMKDQPATLLVQLDLDRMGRPTARGHLLHVDEIINEWYAEHKKVLEQVRHRGIVRGTMDAIKNLALGGK